MALAVHPNPSRRILKIPKLIFNPIIYEIRGRLGGAVFKKTPYSKRIILESYPRRGKPVNKSSDAYKVRWAWAQADLWYRLQNRAWRKMWHDALKKPALTGYQLWMKEALIHINAGLMAPDYPGPGGGWSCRADHPGIDTVGCPPPPIPADVVIIACGVKDLQDYGMYTEATFWWERNPNSGIDEIAGSTLWVAFGVPVMPALPCFNPFMTCDGAYNIASQFWDCSPLPIVFYNDQITVAMDTWDCFPTGDLYIEGPNCVSQMCNFSDGSDWHYTPPP